MEDFLKNVYRKVTKTSPSGKNSNREPKPFKSGKKINTVKSVINHPILNIPAYTFFEDDSYVECRRCKTVVLEKLIIKNSPETFNIMKEHFGEPTLNFFNQYYLYFITENKEWGTEMDFGYLYIPEPKLSDVLLIIKEHGKN